MPAKTQSQEGEFVLEVIAHELGTVIVPESESFGGAAPEAAEVLTDTLAEGFQSLEARGTLDGMNAHTLGRAMVNGGEDGDLAVVEGDRCRGVDAHIRLGRSVVMVPLWVFSTTGTAWRWGASSWAAASGAAPGLSSCGSLPPAGAPTPFGALRGTSRAK